MNDDVESRIIENSDGTLIVRLVEPVKLRGETVERVTLRRIRARDARIYLDEGGLNTNALMLDLASSIAVPNGIVDELLCHADMLAVVEATVRLVGKFHGTDKHGGASSGSSAPDTASPPTNS